MSLDTRIPEAYDLMREAADHALVQRLRPIVAKLQARAGAHEAKRRADVRAKLAQSPHVRRIRDTAHHTLDALRQAQRARAGIVNDSYLTNPGKAAKLGELEAAVDRALSAYSTMVNNGVSALRASAPRTGFSVERPVRITSELGLRWQRSPRLNRLAEIEDAVKTLQVAMDPEASDDARSNALWQLDGYHLQAMERTAFVLERSAQGVSSIASDVANAITTHLNVAFGHAANDETVNGADRLQRDFRWLIQQRDAQLDDVPIKRGAASLFPNQH
jgi:hypothetical protein